MSGILAAAGSGAGLGAYIANHTISVVDSTGSGYDSAAYYTIGSDGVAYYILKDQFGADPAVSYSGEWLLTGAVSDYEVMLHVESGTLDSATAVDTWLSCSTGRTWYMARTAVGDETAVVTVSIRRASSGAVQDTATITFFISNTS